MTRPLTIFEARALHAVAKAAGLGECQRPAGIQSATMQRLVEAGLLLRRVVTPSGAPRRFTRRTYRPRLFWSVTEAGRAVLASPNPAGALAIPAPPDHRMQEDAA